MNRLAPLALLLLPLLAVATLQVRGSDDNVTIYRCTDAKGRLTIGNAPCPKGDQQQERSMLRPKDAPAPAVVVDDAPAQVLPPPSTPRVVVVAAPRPLYECVRPDGSVYESDDGDGDPRWVPLWTLGYPVAARGFDGRRGGGVRSSNGLSAPPSSSISIPPPNERPRPPSPPRPRPPPPGGSDYAYGYGYGAGTWVRDECNVLPQSETCARLDDRRDELRRRFFNAQQRERDVLRVEERGLNARLANDCGVN